MQVCKRIAVLIVMITLLQSFYSCNTHQQSSSSASDADVASDNPSEKKHHKNKKDKGDKDNEDQPVLASANGQCDTSKWQQVYDRDRLQIIDACKVVNGVIEERNADPDGDEHMLLKLDNGQDDLLKKRNYKKKNGDLVVEVVCVNNITRKRAMGACDGYTNNVQLPAVGQHVRVTGSYVIDSHNDWSEIHPVTKIEALP